MQSKTATVRHLTGKKHYSVASRHFIPVLMFVMGALFYCYEYYLRIIPSVMTFELMQAFGVAAAALGNLSAFYYYAYTPMQLLVGVMMDRYGPRRLLTFACIICVVSSYLFGLTNDLHVASVARFFMGFGSAFAFVGVLKLATIWLPENRFAMFSGIASALGTLAGSSGDIWLSDLVQSIGWRQTILLAATIGIGLAVLLYLVIRDHNSITRDAAPMPSHDPTTNKVFSSLGKALLSPQMWIVGLIGCLMYLPTSTFAELWGIPYLRSVYQYTDQEAGFTISMIFLGFTIGAPIAGFISDKLNNRKIPMCISAVCAAVIAFIFIYVPNLSPLTLDILMFLFGFSYSAQAIVFAVGRELYPAEYAGTAVAVTNMFVMLGGVFFEPFVGELLDLNWKGIIKDGVHVFGAADYQYALMVLPLGMIVAAGLTFLLKKPKHYHHHVHYSHKPHH